MTTPAFSLRQLRYFVAVAEGGQVKTAAEKLHLSEAALSSAISSLESALCVQLVVRKKAHGATLTPLGQSMLADARELLAKAERFQERARGSGRSLSGRLGIGVYTTLAPFLLPTLLEGFGRTHPNVILDVLEGSLLDLQEALRDGRCEIAILYGVGIAPDITMEPLFSINPSVLIDKRHALASEPNLQLSQLAHEPIILFDVPPARRRVEEILRLSGINPPIRFRSTNFELIRALVGRGEGFSILYQLPASSLTYDGHEIVAHRLDLPEYAVSVVLSASKDLKPTARARAFEAFCRGMVFSPFHAPAVPPSHG